MTKKLEPGCKAITVNCIVPENNGKIVTVLKIGKAAVFKSPDGSLMTTRVVYVDRELMRYDGSFGNEVNEIRLRRIDDKEETTTWEAMRDLWVPEQVMTEDES